MQGSVFLQLNAQSQVIGHGRIVGSVGKSGDHWLIEYAGRPPYRRIFGLDALSNFAIFANDADRAAFLNPPKPAPAAAPVEEKTVAAQGQDSAQNATPTEKVFEAPPADEAAAS